MNFPLKSIATAVGLILAGTSAHAQLAAPTLPNTAPLGTGTASNGNGLLLAVWDTAGSESEVVNLGYNYSQLTAASGNLAPTGPNAAFSSVALLPGGGSGLQLNFGTINGFTDGLFSSTSSTLQFGVYAVQNGVPGAEGFEATASAAPITFAYGGVGTLVLNVQTEIANWAAVAPPSGNLEDTTGKTTTAVSNTAALNNGQLVTGWQFSGALNTAVAFYNVTTTSLHKSVVTADSATGYFYLSSAGDLTYNVPVAGAPVPVPAAVWLLGSGLLGLAGISRRRIAA